MTGEFLENRLEVDSTYRAIRNPAELRSLVESSPNSDVCVLLISRHSSCFAESLLELDEVLSLRRHGEPAIEGVLLGGADAPLEPLERVATFRGAVPSSRIVATLVAKRDVEPSAPRPDSLYRAGRSLAMSRIAGFALTLLMLVVGFFQHPTISDLSAFDWMVVAVIVVWMIFDIRDLKAERKAIDHPKAVEKTDPKPPEEAVSAPSLRASIGSALLFLANVSFALVLIVLVIRRFNEWVNNRFVPLEFGLIVIAFLLIRVGDAMLKPRRGRREPGA